MSHPIKAGLAGCSSPAVVKFHPRQLPCVLSKTRVRGQALTHQGMAAVGASSPLQPHDAAHTAIGGRAGLPALQEQGWLHLRRAGEDRAASTLRLQPTHRPARCTHRVGASSAAGRRRPPFAYTAVSSDDASCPPLLPCKGAQGYLLVQGRKKVKGRISSWLLCSPRVNKRYFFPCILFTVFFPPQNIQ